MGQKKKSSVQTVIMIIFLSLSVKLIGFLRDAFIGYKLGASSDSDIYFSAIGITTIVFLGVGSAIATNIIPIVVRYTKENKDPRPIANIFNSMTAIAILFSGAYYVVAPKVVPIFVKGYSAEKLARTLDVTRVMIPTLLIICILYFFVGVLQANEKFILPAIISFPFNILFFIYIALGIDRYGVFGLAVITTIGWGVQLAFLLPSVIKHRLLHLKGYLNLKDPDFRHFFAGILPVIFVTLTHQFNIILDNRAASFYGDGNVSAIYYGNMLFTAIVTVTVYGITAVMFPKFNQKYLEDNKEGLYQSVINVLRSLLLLLIPMSVGLILVGPYVIRMVFERGVFDANDTIQTIVAFTGYTSFMIAFGFIDVLNKAFYTLGNRKVPVIVSALVLGLNFLMNHTLVTWFGFEMIPISTSIAFFIGAIISFTWFIRLNKGCQLDRFLNTLYKTLVAALGMAVVVYLADVFLVASLGDSLGGLLILLALDILVGVTVFFGILLVLKEQLITHGVGTLIAKYIRRK